MAQDTRVNGPVTNSGNQATRVVLLGTYDLGKPRTRMLREAMRRIDPDLTEIHHDVWRGIEDKSSLHGALAKLRMVARLLLAYPVLALRYVLTGKHDVVVIGYMGLFDMLLLAPIAKMRGKAVVWDAFLSIYDTYARDRAMATASDWKARTLRWLEQWATRIADRVVLDTRAHAQLMGSLHGVSVNKLDAVLVGADGRAFEGVASALAHTEAPVRVLFYGQFIPLHGINTIIEAARHPRGKRFRWTIVGQGQEASRIDAELARDNLPHLTRIPWVDYEKLAALMGEADTCLGIFGTSDKAARVIPNKVYQAILAGKPVVTRDSPAIRELLPEGAPAIYLVAPGDASALLDALDRFALERADLPESLHENVKRRFAFPRLVEQWRGVLDRALAA